MRPSISVNQKRGRGRPPTGRDPAVTTRLPEKVIAAVDAWAERNSVGSRSEAIRRLVEAGLMAPAGSGKAGTAGDRARSAAGARTVANTAVDHAMKDSGATDEVKGHRKRKLTEMPAGLKAKPRK